MHVYQRPANRGVFYLREKQIHTILSAMKTPLLLLFLIMLPNLGHGAMYKWTNSAGETIYSDTPPSEDSEELNLPILTTTPAVKYIPKSKSLPSTDDKVTKYTEFTLVDPVNDAFFTDNTGDVPVRLSIEPQLDIKAGHSISILIDGQLNLANSQQTTVMITNLDRGTHSLFAEIRDIKGKTLKTSNSVNFTVYRHSRLNKKPPPPPPAN